MTVTLKGFVFFGSALRLSQEMVQLAEVRLGCGAPLLPLS